MRHRFDLHVHSFFSKDAANSPEALIEAAKARGLSGIAVTDHDTCEAHDYMVREGLENPAGLPVDGFLIVPGVEVSTLDGHLLCIGTTLPDYQGRPAGEVVAAIHERGGIAIPAHPYDFWRAGIRREVLDALDLKAIEVFNAAVSSRKFNEHALAYAKERGLAMTASSDAHHASAVGVSSTAFELEELSLPALLAALPRGGEPLGQYLSFGESVKKTLGNFFRMMNPRPDSVTKGRSQ